mmetsp:Transcript_36992/g.87396  ORF Transcript_36992/g.87396 Transcript_36992/m.87396 type:complete len:90 (-) Transcript_36992:15-284(-)
MEKYGVCHGMVVKDAASVRIEGVWKRGASDGNLSQRPATGVGAGAPHLPSALVEVDRAPSAGTPGTALQPMPNVHGMPAGPPVCPGSIV